MLVLRRICVSFLVLAIVAGVAIAATGTDPIPGEVCVVAP